MSTIGNSPTQPSRTPWLWLAGLFLLALLVRVWRLDWQPLWWDEGYSVYFATEPFPRMLWLTAHDIHPPLYYALLKVWYLPFGAPSPVALRLLSVVLGAASVPALYWMARQYYADSVRTAWIAAILLAVSPMHLFYSQEVRMYALATLLAILSSGFLWRALRERIAGGRLWLPLALYSAASLALLYTLYYGALLLLAQAVWVIWLYWRNRTMAHMGKLLRDFAIAWMAILALYLPWLLYALPKLIPYIQQKVASDQDVALLPLEYVTRHLNAFLAGHVQNDAGLERWAALLGVVAIAFLTLALVLTTRKFRGALRDVRTSNEAALEPTQALALFVAIPFFAAFLVNLVNPFFPEGGERLLLFVLPLALTLVAHGIDLVVWRLGILGWAPAALLVAAAIVGIYLFYSTPRHVQEDYRPLLADIAHAGRDTDTIFTTFPWQVGYWRAYKPTDIEGPDTFLMSPFAIEYSPQLILDLQWMLAEGTLWFPEPLAFGSDLPLQVEGWLGENAANIENRWYSLTTRLTAWSDLALPRPTAPAATFGDFTLMGSALGSEPLPADNSPLPIALLWDEYSVTDGTHGATLRLEDATGRTWASRDYAPIGAFARTDEGDLPLALEHLGLLVPPGTPPGDYRLMLGVTEGDALVEGTSDDGQRGDLIDLGSVAVVNPANTVPPGRFKMGAAIRNPAPADALTLLGYTTPVSPVLAGMELPVTLFARGENAARANSEIELYVEEDPGASTWRGWPLPDYPTSQWQQGLITRVPVALRLSPYLLPGEYHLVMRWIAETGAASEPIGLGTIAVRQRAAGEWSMPEVPLDPVPQFGVHALLRGYSLKRVSNTLNLSLTWEALQPLVPEHNIFVHVDDSENTTLAQSDGPPITAQGIAPTSTWRMGESLVTQHTIVLPNTTPGSDLVLRVGLYEPDSEVRLPVSIYNAITGDSVEIPLPE